MTTEAEVIAAIERLLRAQADAVILQAPSGFVQLAEHGDAELVFEAAGDDILPERLSTTELRILMELGFDPPGRSRTPNHVQHLPRSTSPAKLASMALDAMVRVYATEPAGIELVEV